MPRSEAFLYKAQGANCARNVEMMKAKAIPQKFPVMSLYRKKIEIVQRLEKHETKK